MAFHRSSGNFQKLENNFYNAWHDKTLLYVDDGGNTRKVLINILKYLNNLDWHIFIKDLKNLKKIILTIINSIWKFAEVR